MPGGSANLFVLVIVMVAMWFLLIRPQQQRQKQHVQTVAQLRAGQRIVTIGGLVGEIVEVRGDRVLLQVADGSRMEYMKDAVSRVLADEDEPDEVEAEDVEDADADATVEPGVLEAGETETDDDGRGAE